MSGVRLGRACPKCNTVHYRSHAYCAPCQAAYMREWRKTHRLSGDALKRSIARAKANVYLKRGKIERRPCEVCGGRAQMHHHKGYEGAAAYDVQWLCRTHHLAVHTTA